MHSYNVQSEMNMICIVKASNLLVYIYVKDRNIQADLRKKSMFIDFYEVSPWNLMHKCVTQRERFHAY